VIDFLTHRNKSKYVGIKPGSKFASMLKAFADIEAEANTPEAIAKRQEQASKVVNLLDSFTDPEPPKAA
jgi:hypothetical protein